VNAILNEHQIVVDIVAFVNKGDFPRSRLWEKQRGKILAGWVTRKMRTMAQFAIRDMDPAAMGGENNAGVADADPNRSSMGSLRNSGIAGAPSGLRMGHAPQILEQEEFEQQLEQIAALPSASGVAEMPAGDQDILYGRPGLQPVDGAAGRGDHIIGHPDAPPSHGFDLPDFDHFGRDETPLTIRPLKTESRVGEGSMMGGTLMGGPGAPQVRLPGVDGRESLDLWTSPSRSDTAPPPPPPQQQQDDGDWTRDAIMHMNLAGDMIRRSDG
jgi:hypothetical protein